MTTASSQEIYEVRKGIPWSYALAFAVFYGLIPFTAHFGVWWMIGYAIITISLLWVGVKMTPLNTNFWGGYSNDNHNNWATAILIGLYGLSTSLGILTPDFSLATTAIISAVYVLLMLVVFRRFMPWRDSPADSR